MYCWKILKLEELCFYYTDWLIDQVIYNLPQSLPLALLKTPNCPPHHTKLRERFDLVIGAWHIWPLINIFPRKRKYKSQFLFNPQVVLALCIAAQYFFWFDGMISIIPKKYSTYSNDIMPNKSEKYWLCYTISNYYYYYYYY